MHTSPDPLRYENSSTDPDDVALKLASLVARSGRVLDVGCGTGSVTEIIKSRTGANVIGLEPDPERHAMAVRRGLNVYCELLSEDFLRRHGPFDSIVFADVLEHLPSPGEILMLAKKGLAPGGSVVASVPNIAHLFVRINLVCGRFDYQDFGIMDATHLRWFTRKTVTSLFSNLGFSVTAHLYTVNTNMAEYHAVPWRWIPGQRRLIRTMVRVFPNLFGCQHVVRAEPIA